MMKRFGTGLGTGTVTFPSLSVLIEVSWTTVFGSMRPWEPGSPFQKVMITFSRWIGFPDLKSRNCTEISRRLSDACWAASCTDPETTQRIVAKINRVLPGRLQYITVGVRSSLSVASQIREKRGYESDEKATTILLEINTPANNN